MEALIPEFLPHYVFYGLILLSCFTSMLSISVGMGGGTIMLAVIAQVLPVPAIIPVHGMESVIHGFQSKRWWAICRRLGLNRVNHVCRRATGPFVLAMLRGFALSPQRLVSTLAACLVIQHVLKVIAFGLLGFSFAPYLPLIVLMIASGFIGTLIGRRRLLKVDEVKFKRGINIVLTILTLRLLINAMS
jgi:uncharacterized membrane protein YfcA